MRQKYCSLLWSNDAAPVSANIGTLAALSSGAVMSASSELGPSTPNKRGMVASISAPPLTPSAGLPCVSTPVQPTLRVSTPPAVLIAAAAASQPAIASGPNDSSWPVNGLKTATLRVEFSAAPGCADEHAAVVETAMTAAAATSARARVRRDLREVTSRYRTQFLYAARVLRQKRPAAIYLNAPGPSRYVTRARRRPEHNYPNPSSLAMSIRCTSEVPSPISSIFASR